LLLAFYINSPNQSHRNSIAIFAHLGVSFIDTNMFTSLNIYHNAEPTLKIVRSVLCALSPCRVS
jgi:hypothetical protein